MEYGGGAQEFYEKGIRLSLKNRSNATDAAINNYINSNKAPITPGEWDVGPMSNISVAFDTDGSFERKLEQIITQKWLALYPDGIEAWAERRRTGYPRGYKIIESLNPNLSEDELFRRVRFVESEYQDNMKAIKKALDLLDGPDRNDTRVWWDAKPLSKYPLRNPK